MSVELIQRTGYNVKRQITAKNLVFRKTWLKQNPNYSSGAGYNFHFVIRPQAVRWSQLSSFGSADTVEWKIYPALEIGLSLFENLIRGYLTHSNTELNNRSFHITFDNWQIKIFFSMPNGLWFIVLFTWVWVHVAILKKNVWKWIELAKNCLLFLIDVNVHPVKFGLFVRKCPLTHWRNEFIDVLFWIYLFPFELDERVKKIKLKHWNFALCANLSKCINRDAPARRPLVFFFRTE